MKIRSVGWNGAEFIEGVVELTDEECGVYARLISLIYARNEAIDFDLLAKVCSSRRDKLERIVSRLETAGKLTRNGRTIEVERCMNELTLAEERMNKGQFLASKRWPNNGLADATRLSDPAIEPLPLPLKNKILTSLPSESHKPRERKPKRRGNEWQPLASQLPVAPPSDSSTVTTALREAPAESDRVQQAFAFATTRMPYAAAQAACLGMMGEDPDHTANWWLEHVEQLQHTEQA